MLDEPILMNPNHLPLHIDLKKITEDFALWGWKDYKVDVMCDFPNGYVAKLRAGHIQKPSYLYAVRLFNLWVDEGISAYATRSNTT